MKLCRKCGTKNSESFLCSKIKYKSRVYLYYLCRSCSNKLNKQHYLKYKGRYRSKPYDGYYRTDKYRILNRIRIKKYLKKNPQKYKARYTLRNALVSGKINKPPNCQDCGLKISKLEAHHSDYSKPLDIKWLCKICHVKTTFMV